MSIPPFSHRKQIITNVQKYYRIVLGVPSVKDDCFSALISNLSFGPGVITDL